VQDAVEALLTEVESARGDAPQLDDITLALIERQI
jgi:hypothetical protein